MATDYGVQKRAQGKAETQARIAWELNLSGLRFRCLRTSWEPGPQAFLVQIKKQGGIWNNTTHLGAHAGELLRGVLRASEQLLDNLWHD